ncbi:hypothetical protein GOBAR_DD13312 [Gossypium barbadense]|nr:hypothetical protein GOBAR_DD13312 [Gossypium barbadense]
MAYLRPLIFYILAALAIFMLISPSHSSLDNVNDNVTVSLYYETSLCPRCASFISNDLVKVFHTDLHTITNLRLVPWSNAEIHCQVSNSILHFNIFSLLTNEVQFLSSTVTNYSLCNNVQHGEEECHLNTIHSCVIHFWPDVVTSISHKYLYSSPTRVYLLYCVAERTLGIQLAAQSNKA